MIVEQNLVKTLSVEDRNRFELMKAIDAKQVQSCNSIECFFVERAKQLLAPGGVAAIILPSSILSNGNLYAKMREILLKYFDIVAIAEFGSGTFGKTGTNTATLFLRRKSGSPDLADHIANRVTAWFKGDFTKDKVFKDTHRLHAYCAKIGVPPDEYIAMLEGRSSDLP
ncbi:MAG: N-6 DNA methylase [Kiritimatiellaeota bacterium]|nr:N-6 DNA methylase [Kiritimatiellota bacterium]